jgi:predicted nucleic acid-binding protein
MLLDSNMIIYAALPEYGALQDFIAKHAPAVSAISRVEVLGYHLLTQQDRSEFEEFFAAATVLPVSDLVISKAIELRQVRKLKLGDALIAGTALAHGLTLVTKDTQDFQWIDGLTLLDPLESQQSTERQANDSNAV